MVPCCNVSKCSRRVRCKGLCSLHYQRFWRNGHTDAVSLQLRGKPSKEIIEKTFWSLVDKTEDCWVWIGKCKDALGYADFRGEPAHRFSYRSFVGEIGNGHEVCHKCDNPCCVRPSHLFIGTHQDNMMDMVLKRRRRTILQPAQVLEIRRQFDGKWGSKTRLSEKFGVSEATINRIISRRNWGWLT